MVKTPCTLEEHGIEASLSDSGASIEISVNLSFPQTCTVIGVDEKTGTEKRYQLRVTHAGRLVLQ